MSESIEKKKPIRRKKVQETTRVKKDETKIEPKQADIKLVSFVPEFLSILTSFFLVNHKYVALQEIEGGTIIPAFFVVLEEWNEKSMKCQFYKHTITEKDAKGYEHVKPDWDQPTVQMNIDASTIWNCLPFDETRDYFYG